MLVLMSSCNVVVIRITRIGLTLTGQYLASYMVYLRAAVFKLAVTVQTCLTPPTQLCPFILMQVIMTNIMVLGFI
jgi:hypothetical protein